MSTPVTGPTTSPTPDHLGASSLLYNNQEMKSKNPKFMGIFSYKLDLFCTFIDEKIWGSEFLTI
jgi:hypothetical protein